MYDINKFLQENENHASEIMIEYLLESDDFGKWGDPDFLKALDEIRDLHIKKAKDYGTTEDSLSNIRASQEFGLNPALGVAIRLCDKVKRLQAWGKRGELANESVEDAFMDIAAYGIIGLTMVRQYGSNPRI